MTDGETDGKTPKRNTQPENRTTESPRSSETTLEIPLKGGENDKDEYEKLRFNQETTEEPEEVKLKFNGNNDNDDERNNDLEGFRSLEALETAEFEGKAQDLQRQKSGLNGLEAIETAEFEGKATAPNSGRSAGNWLYCTHRWSKITQMTTKEQVSILMRCRRCGKVRGQRIYIDKNSQRVFTGKEYFDIPNT